MKSHASMNRIYRLVWNAALSLWVAVAENAKGRSKGGSARSSVQWEAVQTDAGERGGGGAGFRLNTACRAALVLFTSLAVFTHEARAADAANASVSAGAAGISTVGNITTINQSTQRVAIDWTSLSTAANEALRFNQPNASAIALNRITGSSPSELLGSLTANGQVFILNPNGVLFGAGSQVNVGGLVASTLSMSNADFMAGNHVFTGSGGAVVNQGTLTAANGGYIALLAPEVRSEGVMTASLGTALLAAGNKVTLNIDNGSLLGYSIDQGAINALAENKQLIQANGGQVLLSAKAMDSLTTATVNNTGVIEAKTIQNKAGRILLMGDMGTGTVNVGGTLDASAPNGGDGGFVETSAAHVKVADSARVTTLAAEGSGGRTGTWLIDPNDFTISATGDMSAAAVATALTGGNFQIATATMGSAGGNGDIHVNETINRTDANTLTLTAERDINFNAGINKTAGGAADLTLSAGRNIGFNANITTSSNALALTANADGDITGGGTLNLNGGAMDMTAAGTVSIAQIFAGSVKLKATNGELVVDSGTDWRGSSFDLFAGTNIRGSAGAANIIMNAPGGGNVTASAGSVGNGKIQLNASGAIGALNLTSQGTGGGGQVEFSSDSAVSNVFITAAHDVSASVTGSLDLNGLTLTGLNQNVNMAANGGTLTLGAFNAGAGNLTLSGGSIAMGGALSAKDLSLSATNGLNINQDLTATGNLTLAASNAAIQQTAGALVVGGTTSVNAGAGQVSLTGANNFTGAVSVSNLGANNVAINAGSGSLTLGTSSVGSGVLNVTASAAGGDISIANGATISANGGNVQLTGHDIIFNGTGSVTTTGDVYLAGHNIQQAGTGIAVTANNLAIRSSGYIGNSGAADKLNTQVNTLSAVAPGAISVSNTGALTVDTATFGGSAVPGGVIVGVSSTGGAIALATVDTGGATDNLVLNKSVTTTGGSANSISLAADDHYVQNAGAFVTTLGANATLSAVRSLTINETGTAVSTSGVNGAVDANGQNAGSISVGTLGSTFASINILGSLAARGGAANNGSGNTSASSNAAFSGGSGGSVTLQTATGNTNTITVGNIDAAGGNGAASAAGVYGVGGNGGAILIRSNGASSAIQTGHLSSSGAAPGYIGDGGHAGAVTVEGLGANSGVTTGNISAAGGIGSFQGQFALGASGGNGGNVTVNGKGNVTTGFIDAHGEGASANTGRNNLTTGRGGVIAVTASTGSSDVSTGALSSYSGDAFCNGNRSCTLQAAGNITVSSTGFIKVDGAVQAQGGNANGGNAPNNGAAAGNVSITSTATTSGKSVLINGGINAAGGNGRGGNGFGSGASGGAAGSVTVSSAGVGGAGSNVAIAGGINALGGAASGTGAQAVAGASKAVNVTATDGYVWQAAGNYFNGASVAVTANRGIGAGNSALDMTGATAPDMSSRLGVAAVNSTARNGQGNAATKAGALRVTYAGGPLVLGTQFQNGFAAGDFDLAVPNGDLTVSGLGRTGSANVSLSTGGNLTLPNYGLVSAVSGNIRLEAGNNISFGYQSRAETAGDMYVSAGGNITQNNEYHSLVANNLAIRAGGVVGEGSGNGRLVTQANNLSLAAGGNVILYNNTALNIGSVTFAGGTVPGGAINGASSSGGSMTLGSGGTLSGTGPVSAGSVSLSAVGGINLNVDTASLSASDTSGPINITLANGGTVENVSTTGTVDLTATAGNLDVKTVSGSGVTLTAAAGAITDANGTDNNITATTLTASSRDGIALDTDVSGLQTLSTTGATGDISISTARAIDTANYNISTDSGSAQNVSLISSSASGITVGNAFASTNDNISLTATAGGINLNSAIGAAGLALNAQGTISAPAAINVTGVFDLKAGTFSQVGTLPTFSAGDFRISGGTFVRTLAGDGLSTGTAYQIADIYGLQGVGSAGMLNQHYVLANNIDASGTASWNNSGGFKPIGSAYPNYFSGTFNGAGYTINDLTINRPAESYVGLFGYAGISAATVISNVGLVNANVTGGTYYVGSLVAFNQGTISNSYSTGSVAGGSAVGGLVGYHPGGSISNSYSTANVIGNTNVGGLVGQTAGGTINNTYASGTVSGDRGVGGLAGSVQLATVSNSYSSGAVSGNSSVGGLVGDSSLYGVVDNSFWNTTTSGQATSSGGTGKTTAEMQQASTFTDAGWSASNVGGDGTTWRIYEGNTGPLLRSFLTGLTLADTSVTYNGSTQTGASTALAGVSGSSASARNAGSYLTGYYSNQQGYDIIGGGLDIAKADLTLSTSDVTKTYDGTTLAAGAAVARVGTALLGGDTASGGFFEFTNKNFGVGNKSVTASGVTVNDGNGGNNYNVSYVDNTTSTINKADLTVTATGVTKTYDGTLGATGTGSVGTLAGVAAGEVVNTAATQAFTDKNFGIGNKTVQASGLTIKDAGNADVTGNYNIAYVDNTTSTINKANLTVTATGVTKTYDGTLAATGTGSVGTLAGVGAGESVNTAATQVFTDKNFGIGNKTVQASGLTIKDAGNADVTGNYNIAYVDNTTSTINKADLTVTANAVTKTYDGTMAATGTGSVGTLAGVAAGEVVDAAGSQAFINKNFGIGNKSVRASGVTIKDSGNADVTGNYNIAYVDNTTSTINKADLSLSTSDVTKTYDGGFFASGTVIVTAGTVFAGDNTTGGAFTFIDKNAGTGNKTVLTSGVTVGDGVNNSNYNVSYVSNNTSTINQANLVLTTNNVTKTYDGTMAASGTAAVSAGTLFGGDSLTGGSFAFTDKNAGTGNKTVTASGVTVGDGVNNANYNVSYVNNTTSTINKADLTVTATGVTKTYDGTLAATGTGSVGTLAGVAAGEVVNTAAAQAFTDKNFGIGNKIVQASGLTIKDAGNADVTGNYNIAYVDNTTSTINKADLTLSTSNVTKTYDGGLSASGAVIVTAGTIFLGDNATGGAFAFTNKNAGMGNKTVTTSGVTVGDGANNANYNVSYADNTSSTINQANLVLSTNNVTKTYDGNTAAAGSATVTGGTLFSGDSLTGGSFAFTDKNAGNGNKTVQTSGVTVGDGVNNGNYAVTYADNTTSTINPFAVSVSGTRTYDGTADVAAGVLNIGPLVGSETLGLSGLATMADKNVGANKTLTVAGLNLVDGSGLASNYTFTGGTQQASITQASLTVGSGNVTKTYDSTTAAAGTATVTGGTLFAGDSLTGGTFAFTDKNAGTGNKTVTTSGVTVGDGVNNGNYAVTYTNNTSSTINKADLTVTASGVDKVYDGSTAATVGYGDNRLGSDVLSVTGAASFADKNAGNGKAVGVSSIALGGTDAGNYNLLNTTAGTTASITPKALTVTANNDSKQYDGAAYSGGNGVSYSGFVAGDSLSDIGGILGYGGSSQGAVAAGNYVITAGGLNSISGNYALGFASGALSIRTSNASTAALGNAALVSSYDGAMQAVAGLGGSSGGGGMGGSADAMAGALAAAAADAGNTDEK